MLMPLFQDGLHHLEKLLGAGRVMSIGAQLRYEFSLRVHAFLSSRDIGIRLGQMRQYVPLIWHSSKSPPFGNLFPDAHLRSNRPRVRRAQELGATLSATGEEGLAP